MDNVPAAPQVCVLKMNVKCEACQKKLKKQLQKLHGVHSINIDANEGTVSISSTIDPHLLIEEFTKVGKKAELLWDKRQFLCNQNKVEKESNQKTITANDQYHKAQIAELQELAKNRRVKNVELTQTRNIKVTFNDHDDFKHVNDHTVKIVMEKPSEAKPRKEPNPPPPVNGDGCGRAMNNVNHPCCHHESPPPPPPPPYYTSCHASPPNNVDRGTPPADVNCGEEHKSCSLM